MLEYFKYFFIGSGFLILIITLIMLMRKMKQAENKITVIDLSFLVFGMLFLGAGIYLFISEDSTHSVMEKNNKSNEVTSNYEEDYAENENQKDDNAKNSTSKVQLRPSKTIDGYQKGKDSLPKVDEKKGLVVEADGTTYNVNHMITPEKTYILTSGRDEIHVLEPQENQSNDSLHKYHGVTFIKGELSELSEYIYSFSDEDVNVHKYENREVIDSGFYYNVNETILEFGKKHMPLQKPVEKKLVDLPFLIGEWTAYHTTKLHGMELLANVSFFDDATANIYIAELLDDHEDLNSIKHYKFEEVAPNAYKLYLYQVNEIDGQLQFYENEPLKRNFMIYVTSDETIEFVYYDQYFKRKVITLTRGLAG